MSIDFENSPAEWNNAGTEPGTETKNNGFSPGDKPPAAWINWQFNKTYNSIKEIQDTVSSMDTEVKKTVPVSKGGTGSTTASSALSNLGGVPKTRTINSKELSNDVTLTYSDVGAAASSHNHSASAITSGTLPISRGGTGSTTSSSALSNLGGVPKTRTINSKALSSNIELSCADIGAASYEIKNNVDFNEMKTPGLYTMRSSTTNAPSSSGCHSLIVNKSDNGDYVQQIAIKESSHEIYIRYLMSSSGWSVWEQILTSAETGEKLYSNASGTSGTVALSAPASDYNYLVIYFRNYDNQFGSMKIYSPNGKTTSLELNDHDSSQGWFSRGCTATISGSSITLSNQILAYISSNAAWSTLNGSIKITRVEGWQI